MLSINCKKMAIFGISALFICGGTSLVAENMSAQTIPRTKQEYVTDTITYNGWTSSALWGGGYVQNVVLCPSDPNRCYTYVDMAGLYRSDDCGRSWRMLHGALDPSIGLQIRGLSVDPRNADRIIVVVAARNQFSKGFILSSTDAGKSFCIVERMCVDNWNRRATGFIIDRNPRQPDEILVGSYDGVLQSTDNGKTWKNIFKHSLNPTDLRFDITDNKRIWLCSPAKILSPSTSLEVEFDPGFYGSEDGGRTWGKISDKSPTEIAQSNVSPHELYGIFDFRTIKRSTDGGKSWADWMNGLQLTPVEYPDLWCNKNIYTTLTAGKDFILTASTLNDFYRLDHGSDTWKSINIESIDPRDYLGAHKIKDHAFKATGSISIDPADPNHWYATDYYNIWQTPDGGKHWVCTSTGMSQIVVKSVFRLPGTHDFVVTMMDHSWYISKDSGKTFQPYEPASFGYERMYFQVAPSNPQIMYTSGPRASVVSVSRDGGKTWKIPGQRGLPPRKHGNPNAKEYYTKASIAVDPKNPELIYLGIAPESTEFNNNLLGVYVSSDGGDSWKQMSKGLPAPTQYKGKGFFENTNVCGYELAISKSGTPVCMSIAYNYVCRWNKEKESWEVVCNDSSRPWELADLQTDPFSDRMWLAAKESGLLYSDDDGKTWKSLKNFPGYAARMSFDTEKSGRFAVVTKSGLYLTEDNAKTWWLYDLTGKIPVSGADVAIDGDNLLLGSPNSGVFYHHIQRNADGSPKGFVKKDPEKVVYGLDQFKDFFGDGKLYLLPDSTEFTTSGEKHVKLFNINSTTESIKMQCDKADQYATVCTAKLDVTPGQTYRINFQVRGNVKLAGYINDLERKNFMWDYPLKNEWTNISQKITPSSSGLTVSLLCWKQQGWVEFRNFSVVPEA